jgi:D-glycero-D-manno-heptose 1,7-bisphosphate phosphatase
MGGAPVVFIDRDGTLIRELGYLASLQQIEVLARVPESIRLLRENGFKVIVITNQSAVARGLLQEKDLQRIHHELEERLARSGAFLDGIYYCPHHPTEGINAYRVWCDCRKPNVGMVTRAARELNLDLSRSYVVGDQSTDMELATRIGAKGVLIDDGERKETRGATKRVDCAARDLWEAAQWIMLDFQRRDGPQR